MPGLISLNVGLPREVVWRGEPVLTGIYKEPVSQPLRLRRLNLDGDRQADLTVHGGAEKAVYGYPSEHYPYWKSLFPANDLSWGMFGENLTTEGLLENEICIGDQHRVGTALLSVTQPRMPCYKLGIKFDDPGVIRQFLKSGRPGFYYAVLEEGEVAPGSEIEVVYRDPNHVTVVEIASLLSTEKQNAGLLRRAVAVPALAAVLRDYFSSLLG